MATDKDGARMDRALGMFTQSQWDLKCGILQENSQCTDAPDCTSDHGPAGLAILKSLTVLHNEMGNRYGSLKDAHLFASNQMEQFTETFAPMESLHDKALETEIWFVIAGAAAELLAAFFTSMGTIAMVGAVGGLAVGLASVHTMSEMVFNQPTPIDTATILANLLRAIQGAYQDISDQLFIEGSIVHPGSEGMPNKTTTWLDLMADGHQLTESVPDTMAQEENFERIIYQQLAVYSWMNLHQDGAFHYPFIVAQNKICKKQNPDENDDLNYLIPGIGRSESGVDFEGYCYYLQDAQTTPAAPGGLMQQCVSRNLPGGNSTELRGKKEAFAGLTLSDIIIPAVKGWKAHNQQNGWRNDLNVNTTMFTNPREAGTVQLPICDYFGHPEMPGTHCPRLGLNGGDLTSKPVCDMWDESYGKNDEGVFDEGDCKVKVTHWKKNQGINAYQLTVDIFDNSNRLVGSATKQSAARTLEVANTVLAYNLLVIPGAGDNDPVYFWYADQSWDSDSPGHVCQRGDWDHGKVRKLDCHFQCGKPVPKDFEKEDHPAGVTLTSFHTFGCGNRRSRRRDIGRTSRS